MYNYSYIQLLYTLYIICSLVSSLCIRILDSHGQGKSFRPGKHSYICILCQNTYIKDLCVCVYIYNAQVNKILFTVVKL